MVVWLCTLAGAAAIIAVVALFKALNSTMTLNGDDWTEDGRDNNDKDVDED